MKKIGVISDIHGNIEALTAILASFDEIGCDEVIHTGDAVDIGPCSRECLELLLSRSDATLLLGNHDRDFLLNESLAKPLSHVPTEHKRQVFASMNENLRKAVSHFPYFVTRECGGDELLFVHYALKDDYASNAFPFCPLIPAHDVEYYDEVFKNYSCQAVFFGHKHEPCDIEGDKLYVDVGSVGCYPEPLARGIVIEYDDSSWCYKRIHVPYDMARTRAQMQSVAAGEQLYDFYFLHNKTDKEG